MKACPGITYTHDSLCSLLKQMLLNVTMNVNDDVVNMLGYDLRVMLQFLDAL